MEVVPVIDLLGGAVVHARGGRRSAYRPIETPLSPGSGPRQVVAGLLRLAPFRRLYIADLDAIGGGTGHGAVIGGLAAEYPGVEFWTDPGIADAAAAHAWLARCAGCLVLGSETLADAATLQALREERRVILSLDFRDDAFQGPRAVLEEATLWPARVIVMTLARVGGGAGPDVERVAGILDRAGERAVFAAGGVRDGADLRALAELGAAGVLVASALHAGAIAVAEVHPPQPPKPRRAHTR